MQKANSKFQKETCDISTCCQFTREFLGKRLLKKDFKEVPVSEKEIVADSNAAALNQLSLIFVNSAYLLVE